MTKIENNYAFIDAQNVNLAIQDQGWKLDWKKLRVYLKDKYKVSKAYLFIGYIANNQDLYAFLQGCGYILIFKDVLELKSGKTKGNVDAELVLQTMIDYDDYSKAIIITGDGDFACLIKYFYSKNKLAKLIVPNKNKYSIFLKQTAKEKIDNLSNLKEKLKFKDYKGQKRTTKKGPPIKHQHLT